MKKLFAICLIIMAISAVDAQNKITGTMDLPKYQVRNFDKINFEVSYQVVDDRGTISVKVSNPKIFVHPDSKYNYQGKLYSRQDLGLANWPQTQRPVSFGVFLSVQYPGGTVNHMFSCTDSGICKDNNEYILRSVENTNKYKPSDFSVSYNGMMTYTGQGDEQVERLIMAKTKTGSKSNTATGNATTDDSTTETYTSSYTPTSSKQEVTNQAVAGAAVVVGGLLDEWNASIDRKEKRREAEKKTAENILERRYEAKFRAEFLPLMKKAKAGDENARMILYFASNKIELMDYVPDRWGWLDEAANNNNTDALLEKAERIFTGLMYNSKSRGTEEDFNHYIDRAVELGSAEALLRKAFYGAFITPTIKQDTKKSLEIYTEVAAQGNPIAMYNLGMIYKYGYLEEINKYNKQYYSKFDVELDESKAMEWFLKGYEALANDTYQESLFSRSILSGSSNVFGSYIINDNSVSGQCLRELSKIYKEGKTIPKDKKKAKEYENMALSLRSFVRKQKLYNIDAY